MRRPWTVDEIAMLTEHFANMPTHELAEMIGRSRSAVDQAANLRGLRKSPEQRERSQAKTNAVLVEVGKAHRRRPGEAPWNKGRHYQPRNAGTRFERGHKPQTWLPVGTERIDKDGVLKRKVSDTGNRRADWKPVHVIAWEATNGPVPPGMIVLTSGDLVSRADLMRRNSVHNLPKELALAVQLVGALNRQIRNRA